MTHDPIHVPGPLFRDLKATSALSLCPAPPCSLVSPLYHGQVGMKVLSYFNCLLKSSLVSSSSQLSSHKCWPSACSCSLPGGTSCCSGGQSVEDIGQLGTKAEERQFSCGVSREVEYRLQGSPRIHHPLPVPQELCSADLSLWDLMLRRR